MNFEEKLKLVSKENIAVIYGGLSSEREISLKTGKGISNALNNLKIKHKLYDFNFNTINELLNDKVTLAFIALHGKYGEDGTIQSMLEFHKIKYTGCGPLCSAITMSKKFTKYVFKANNITTPDFVVINKNENIYLPFDLPLVIKPDTEGSSIGLTIAFNEKEYYDGIEKGFQYCDELVIEKYISGRELTAGIIGTKNKIINLPIIEIKPKNKYFDYEAKYTKGLTDFIVPAEIPEFIKEKIFIDCSKIFKIFDCSGMSRIDIIYDEKNQNLFYLEINTIPGFTETSLLPKAAKAIDISYENLVLNILYYAI
ncbi:MAG TPA: D-alanine--D-alanine ligase [bacterium]|nr:D-alanine--D-alanine ligase [bacterium]HOL46576.1 D-alanine--D-alanine ligase [bacterium]HPQ17853.1 D-alanine--D-alanine ligase [bacterium]